MKILRLYVRNFRNIREFSCDQFEEFNQIIGENGQGKTSFLEALFVSFTGSSFRTHHPKELIRHGERSFVIEVEFEKYGVTHILKVVFDGQKRKVHLNGAPCESSSILLGLLQGVASTPQDYFLIRGAPAVRRHFLDLQIAQSDPLYVHHLNRYARAIKQRNILLKKKNLVTIETWEHELALSGAYIVKERRKTTALIAPRARVLYTFFLKGIAEDSEYPLDLFYETSVPDDTQENVGAFFEEEFKRRRSQELLLGSTLVGPHRDDLVISLCDQKARDFASEGQVRLCALALKFAEWHSLKDFNDIKPFMLLDDVMCSLDEKRSFHLMQASQELGQVFTSSHKNMSLPKIHKVFTICEGRIANISDSNNM